jgi:gliding motility-associated-like protein
MTMKNGLRFQVFTILLFLLSIQAHSQWQNNLWTGKQAYNWNFGVAAGISFNSTPPVALPDSAIEAGLVNPVNPINEATYIEGSGSISDADGNLLFYTNGATLWNADNEVMLNGGGLMGNPSSTQSSMIVQAPGNPGKYYVFSINGADPPFGAFYSEVDMSLDGGLGAVTSNKNIKIADDIAEKVSAVHHANGVDVWVVIHSIATNEFKSFLVSESGVNTTPVTSNAGYGFLGGVGAMKFSPDGNTIATTTLYFSLYKVELFTFNKVSGTITGLIATLDATDMPGELYGCYAVEFSPNSKLLYASTVVTGRIFQFDLATGNEPDIKASIMVIGTATTPTNQNMQLAPDGKIYIAHGDFGVEIDPYVPVHSTLNVIEYPNNHGLASGYTEEAVDLVDGRSDGSLPSFIQSYFASGILYENQCASQEVTFSTLRIPGITAISWNFGDPDSGAANISSEGHHMYSSPGTYTVTALITSNNVQQEASVQVIIFPTPAATKPEDIQQCASNEGAGLFMISNNDATILGNQENFELVYYTNETDALSGINAITDKDNFSSAGQTIYAVVTNPVTGCSAITQFDLIVLEIPVLTDGLQFIGCAPFDLIAITSQEGTGLELQFYPTQEDALSKTNSISNYNQYDFTGNEITVYVLAMNQQGCTSITSLHVSKDCEIQKGISPNNDGKNDFFDLSGYDARQLSIFNRYGMEVYNKSNYTNEWNGQGDKGDALPTGTYYYRIETNKGENVTGWIYINRQE